MIPPLLFFLYLLYGIPCFILYLIVFILLVSPQNRKRHFSSSFFKLSMLLGFVVSLVFRYLEWPSFIGFNLLCEFHCKLQSSLDPYYRTYIREYGKLFLSAICVFLQLFRTLFKDGLDLADGSQQVDSPAFPQQTRKGKFRNWVSFISKTHWFVDFRSGVRWFFGFSCFWCSLLPWAYHGFISFLRL